MARRLSNFIESYVEYARDQFVPDRFHLWSGLSILAGAIERKIALKQGLIQYVPNIYVMLVSHPKSGKSTAVVRAADLLEELKVRKPDFRILPNQMTEPAFVDLMKFVDRIPIPGTSSFLTQSAGYFYASEASSSALKDPDGFIVAAFTDFWDCPKWFRKKLKSERDSVEIENSCLNLLAGTTFNFLKTLVNETSVLGGFASRLIYVVSHDRVIRDGKWESQERAGQSKLREDLVCDLLHINKLIGPMKPAPSWVKCYEGWIPTFDTALKDYGSERIEGIMARKDTNLIKVSMLLSLAEGDSMTVEGRHFEQALELIEDVYKDNVSVVAAAVMADPSKQIAKNQIIGRTLEGQGGTMSMKRLKSMLMQRGIDPLELGTTVDAMLGNGDLILEGTSGIVRLNFDPDSYF